MRAVYFGETAAIIQLNYVKIQEMGSSCIITTITVIQRRWLMEYPEIPIL